MSGIQLADTSPSSTISSPSLPLKKACYDSQLLHWTASSPHKFDDPRPCPSQPNSWKILVH